MCKGVYCIFSVLWLSVGQISKKDPFLFGFLISVTPTVNSFSAGTVPFHCNTVTLLPKVLDKNIKVTVNREDSSQTVPLNFGDTVVEISVCSADGSNSQVDETWEEDDFMFHHTTFLTLYFKNIYILLCSVPYPYLITYLLTCSNLTF